MRILLCIYILVHTSNIYFHIYIYTYIYIYVYTSVYIQICRHETEASNNYPGKHLTPPTKTKTINKLKKTYTFCWFRSTTSLIFAHQRTHRRHTFSARAGRNTQEKCAAPTRPYRIHVPKAEPDGSRLVKQCRCRRQCLKITRLLALKVYKCIYIYIYTVGTFWHPKDLEVVPHPETVSLINN